MDRERQDKFISALKPNYHEWDCVMNETISIKEWKHSLATNTTVLMSEDTVQSIKDINSLFKLKYLSGGSAWMCKQVLKNLLGFLEQVYI